MLFERELAALVKLVDAEAREVHECAAVKESTFKTVVGVHQEKTSQERAAPLPRSFPLTRLTLVSSLSRHIRPYRKAVRPRLLPPPTRIE